MFCMDDREEGLRRHLEELAPRLETLGTAAHFNVPHAFRALDASAAVPLAPVVPTVVVPAHEVHEEPQRTATASCIPAISGGGTPASPGNRAWCRAPASAWPARCSAAWRPPR